MDIPPSEEVGRPEPQFPPLRSGQGGGRDPPQCGLDSEGPQSVCLLLLWFKVREVPLEGGWQWHPGRLQWQTTLKGTVTLPRPLQEAF